MEAFNADQIRDRLSQMDGWVFDLKKGAHIIKEFQTKNWKTTLFVVNAIASLAEAQWHHPDLEVSFKRVRVKLTTHEAGGITERDFKLAEAIDKIVAEILKH